MKIKWIKENKLGSELLSVTTMLFFPVTNVDFSSSSIILAACRPKCGVFKHWVQFCLSESKDIQAKSSFIQWGDPSRCVGRTSGSWRGKGSKDGSSGLHGPVKNGRFQVLLNQTQNNSWAVSFIHSGEEIKWGFGEHRLDTADQNAASWILCDHKPLMWS